MFRTSASLFGAFVLGAFALVACRPAQAQLAFQYTSFDVPGVYNPTGYGTLPIGISNNGTIVGEYDVNDSMGSGFAFHNGNVTTINYTGAGSGDYTFLYAANSSGVITGDYEHPSPSNPLIYTVTPFIYRNGTFSSPLPVNAVAGTGFYGTVTDSGLVATQYVDAASVRHGAIYNVNTDTFTDVDPVPASVSSDFHLQGVNAAGDYVATYADASGNFQGAFSQGGTFTYLSIAGAVSTRPSGINSSGLVTGRYFNTAGTIDPTGGFLYDHGTFYTLQYPGAQFTNVLYGAINDNNQIVGYYVDQAGVYRGTLITVTAVPEPGSVALLAGMAISGGLFLRRDRKRRVS